MSLGWNPIYLQTAREWVADRLQETTTDADRWAEEAANLADALASFDLGEPIELSPEAFESGPIELREIELSEEIDELPELEENPYQEPTAYNRGGTNIQFNAPTFSESAPSAPGISKPASPNLTAGEFTDAPPSAGDLEVIPPEDLDEALLTPPEVPTLDEIELPEKLQLVIDDLEAERPEFDNPIGDLYENDYLPQANALADYICTEIKEKVDADGGMRGPERLVEMLDGRGTGLPPAIEQALFNRAIARDRALSQQFIDATHGEWARRGFSMPGTTLLQRLAQARQANREQECAVGRDILIQVHQEELNSLRFAVEQGIRLQAQYFEQCLNVRAEARALADGMFQVAKDIFDAKLRVFATQLEIYRTDVQVYSERIRAELAKIELYKGELEGARLQGDLNLQKVQIYNEQVRAIGLFVDQYEARVRAYATQVQAKGQLLDQFRARIEAHNTRLESDRLKLQNYSTAVEAERTFVELYRATVAGFASKVEAYRAEVQAETAKNEAQIANERFKIDQADFELRQWEAGERTRLESFRAMIEGWRAQVEKFAAEWSATRELNEQEVRQRSIDLETLRTNNALAIERVSQVIEQLRNKNTLALGQLESASRVLSQLAASALSAVNLSAQISESSSSQSSQSSSYSETKDISTV